MKPNGIYSERLMRRLGPTFWAYGAYPNRSSKRWPITIVPAVAPVPGSNTLAAVYLANIFERKKLCGAETESAPELDTECLERLGIADRVTIWRTLCANSDGEGRCLPKFYLLMMTPTYWLHSSGS